MALTAKSPEQIKADREAREQRQAKENADKLAEQRGYTIIGLIVAGAVLLLLGAWLLLFAPGIGTTYNGQTVVNLQRLVLGQTSAILGAIALTGGLLLRYRG